MKGISELIEKCYQLKQFLYNEYNLDDCKISIELDRDSYGHILFQIDQEMAQYPDKRDRLREITQEIRIYGNIFIKRGAR